MRYHSYRNVERSKHPWIPGAPRLSWEHPTALSSPKVDAPVPRLCFLSGPVVSVHHHISVKTVPLALDLGSPYSYVSTPSAKSVNW